MRPKQYYAEYYGHKKTRQVLTLAGFLMFSVLSEISLGTEGRNRTGTPEGTGF